MAVDVAGVVGQIAEQFGKDPTRLMDVARAVHGELGHLSEESVQEIAESLGLNAVQVRDMVSFYAFLSLRTQGKTVIRLTDAVVESMAGAEAVAQAFEQELGIRFGETTADGAISLERTACIGLSDQAPNALIDGVPLTNLKPADVSGIVSTVREGKDLKHLPQAEVATNLNKPGPVIFEGMRRGAAVRAAVNMPPEEVINEINKSRLRGRGGAGFPTAMKWNLCRKAAGETRYIICNGDEGEPGTFKDRVILMESPDLLIEGMTVAAYALGASEGFLYLRAEYEHLVPHLEQVLAKRRHLGLLGPNIAGCEGFDFDIRIQLGAGAYICGEESSLIESLEGKRGAPRDRPPFPVQRGFLGQPTSVNNIETLCCAARILEKGGEWFAKIGTKDSTGTKLLSISGDCENAGVFEVEYGVTLYDILEMAGAEGAQAVQVGGPSGRCVAPKDFGRSISFEDLPTGGSIIIFGPERDLLEHVRQFTAFFAEESCGWCVPCRVGNELLLRILGKVLSGKGCPHDLAELERVGNTMKTMSRCGLGQTAANPVLTTLRDFYGLYEARLATQDFVPPFDMDKALEEGCAVTGRQYEHEEVQ